jgi:predicted small lipoprotein YifL
VELSPVGQRLESTLTAEDTSMKKLTWYLSLLLLMLLGLSACGQAGVGDLDVPDASNVPGAVETVTIPPYVPSVGPYSQVVPTGTEPIPFPTYTRAPIPTSVPPTPIVIEPLSPRVEPDKTYQFSLYTHCGLDFATDFDGSFWDLEDREDQRRHVRNIGNPGQRGTMTLVEENRARFDYPGGEPIYFVRHVGPKIIPGFCA